jgi:peptide deformylase
MSILNVIKMGHPTLKKVAKPITEFNDDLKNFTKDMFDTMVIEEGIGLAAPQVNRSIRMIVIDMPLIDEELYSEPMAFINPIITKSAGSFCFEEGCLSVPEIREEIERAAEITVEYQDVDGNKHVMEAEELLAVVFQHEIDHLDGILFVDKLSPMKRSLLKQKLDDIEANALA